MHEIRTARSGDVDGAVAALGRAFASDPLMHYFFRDNPTGVEAGAKAFFAILLRARIALAMPAEVLHEDGAIGGAAMGTTRRARPGRFHSRQSGIG